MKKIRTLIVDDEPLARERLSGLLAGETDIDLIGQARDGEEAATAIQDHSPDLVFLDVQMPQMNGFEVIEAVGSEKMPLVIFVTAYDQHALKAFQVRALDYLLKPFDRERFTEALQRARKQIEREETGDLGRRLLALVKDLRKDQPKSDRLVVKSGGRLFFLRADEIDWIEAAGNYVRLHVGTSTHLLRETMNAIERPSRSREVLPHPSIANRQHGADPGAAAVAERGVRRAAANGHPPHPEPGIPGEAAGQAEISCQSPVTSSSFQFPVPSSPVPSWGWNLATGNWLLATGYWLLATDFVISGQEKHSLARSGDAIVGNLRHFAPAPRLP